MRIAAIISNIFEIAYWIIVLRVFLSWIRTIEWGKQPFKFIQIFADTFLYPFQRLIPPVGGLDLSPIIALIALAFFKAGIVTGLVRLGL